MVPYPYLLLQLTFPPIYSIIFLQIDSPRPVPPLFYSSFSCNLLKSMNNFEIPSSEIPLPLSAILIYTKMFL